MPEEGRVAGGKPFQAEPGVLYLVPTPLGNLRDITLRALDVLSSASVIAAEDTRRTGQLLKLHGAGRSGRMVSYHQHNEARRSSELLPRLAAGDSVALATNAGMPSISDPGYRLVRAAVDAGLRVEALPGASVVTAALAASGLPPDRFCFLGFVPKKPGARGRFLDDAAKREETCIFFESAERLARTLREALEHFGPERQTVVCRELSKLHEELVRGSLAETVAHFEETKARGEITVLVAGQD